MSGAPDLRPESSQSYNPGEGDKTTKNADRRPKVLQVRQLGPSPATKTYGRENAPPFISKDRMTVAFVNKLPQPEGWLQTQHMVATGAGFNLDNILRSNWFWAYFCCDGFTLQMWMSSADRDYAWVHGIKPVGWWDVRALHDVKFNLQGQTGLNEHGTLMSLCFTTGVLDLKAAKLSEAQRWATGMQSLVHYYKEGASALQETEPVWSPQSLEKFWDSQAKSVRGELGFHDVLVFFQMLLSKERVDCMQRMTVGLHGDNVEKRMALIPPAQARLVNEQDKRQLRAVIGDPVSRKNFVLKGAQAVFGSKAHLFTGADRHGWGVDAYAYGDKGERPGGKRPGQGGGCPMQ